MDAFSAIDLKQLAEKRDNVCISIFMPTHRGGQDTPEGRLRLKNFLKDAAERLVARGMKKDEVHEILGPAERLLPEGLFWTHKSDGLALFISPSFFRYYRLPSSFEEGVRIASRFHLKPLLPLLTGNGHFYLLGLGRKHIRFFEGSRDKITELKVSSIPSSLSESMKYTEVEKQLQFHTQTAQTQGGRERAAMYYSHGVGAEIEKDYVREFFDQIDAGLREVFRDSRDPLILAGVEYLLPIYRQANTYSFVLEEAVLGNPEELSLQDIHRQAWPIAERHFLRTWEERLAQYEKLVGVGRTSVDLREIVPAAATGRIDTLFVAMDGDVCGQFDPVNNQVSLQRGASPCDDDLVDLAAVETILHGGAVYPMEPERVPGGAPAAAMFRY